MSLHHTHRSNRILRLICAVATLVGAIGLALGAAVVLGEPTGPAFADGPVACDSLTQPPDPDAGFCADYNGDDTWYGTYGPGFSTPYGYGFCADPPASGGWFPVPAYDYSPSGPPAGAAGDQIALGFAFSQGQVAGWWGGQTGQFTSDQAAAAAKILYDAVAWGDPVPAMDPGVLAAFDDFNGWYVQAQGMADAEPTFTATLIAGTTTNSTTFTATATDQLHAQFPGTGKPMVGEPILLTITNGTFNTATGPTTIGVSTDADGNISVPVFAGNTTPTTVTVSAVASMGAPGLDFYTPAPAYAQAQTLMAFTAPTLVGTTQPLTSSGVPQVQTGTVSVQKSGDDEASVGVGGAVFQILQGSTVMATLTTDETGATPASDPLPIGTYTVHEQTPPAGYTAAPDQTVTVTANQNTVVSFTGEQQDLVIPATLTIEKSDAQGGAPLAGATFDVRYSTQDNGTFDEDLGSCTTETSGQCSPGGNDGPDLYPGTYEITETAAPPGYVLDPTTDRQVVTLTPGEAATVSFSDLLLGSLSLSKTGDDTAYASVTGAVFTLSGPAPATTPAGTLTVGPDGTSNTLRGLVPGTYTLTETTPPAGYAPITPEPIAITAGHATTIVDVLDHVIPATVSLLKVDEQTNAPLAGAVLDVAYDPTHDGDYSDDLGQCTTGASGQCGPMGNDGPTELLPGDYQVSEITPPPGYATDPATAVQDITLAPGATGSVTFRDPLLVPAAFLKVATGNLNPALDTLGGATIAVHAGTASGPVVAGCTTDGAGACTTSSVLVSGSAYCWVETSAPVGLADGAHGCFNATDTQATQPITVVDAGLFVDIAVEKVDAASPSVTLPGATFDLYRQNTGGAAPTLVATAVTGSDGIATFPLQLPGYAYCAVETQAPANYVLPASPHCTPVLTGSATVPPPVTTITVPDTEATITLTAHKFNAAVPDEAIPGATYDLYVEGQAPPAPPPSATPADALREPGDTWYGRATTDASGTFTFTLPAGYAWCLLEHTAPADYEPDPALHCTPVLTTSSPRTSSVVALPETRATLALSADKYDSAQPGTVVPGASYELLLQGAVPAGLSAPAAPAGDPVPSGDTFWAQGTTSAAGVLDFPIPAGSSWCLHELSSPSAYRLDPAYHCTGILTTASSAAAETVALPEVPITPPVSVLAFTGGPSIFVALSGLLCLLGGSGLLLIRRRTERRRAGVRSLSRSLSQ